MPDWPGTVGLSMYLTTEFEAFQHRKAQFAGAKMELFPSIKLTDRIRAFGEFEFNSTIDSGSNPNDRGRLNSTCLAPTGP